MLRGSRRIAVLLASVVLACAVRPALAQPTSVKQRASDLVKRAIAKSEAGDHQAAIKLYNDAYDLAPNSLLLSNIGAQYQAHVETVELFKGYAQAGEDKRMSAFAAEMLPKLQAHLDQVAKMR